MDYSNIPHSYDCKLSNIGLADELLQSVAQLLTQNEYFSIHLHDICYWNAVYLFNVLLNLHFQSLLSVFYDGFEQSQLFIMPQLVVQLVSQLFHIDQFIFHCFYLS